MTIARSHVHCRPGTAEDLAPSPETRDGGSIARSPARCSHTRMHATHEPGCSLGVPYEILTVLPSSLTCGV